MLDAATAAAKPKGARMLLRKTSLPSLIRYVSENTTGDQVRPCAGPATQCDMACVYHRAFAILRAMTENTTGSREAPSLRIRILFGEDAMLGPGKADLLERIRDTGSIAAAGRTMSMSYKRAWMLVEEMNTAFREPLVDSTRGVPRVVAPG
ncbi:winged helix-turn-helix domain-containing protein [Ponticoccus litoralis]|uniref:winged helix-turn-helix domain-containing protein n=1 Tax=Ponticoccus litoralis TaxID=422297 RepID=UPI003D2EF3F6